MKIKYIRWITILGLVGVVALQVTWLRSTFRLTAQQVEMKCDEVFGDAVLGEVIHRVVLWKKQTGNALLRIEMDAHMHTYHQEELGSSAGRILNQYLHVSFQESARKKMKSDISLTALDSIYTHILDSAGVRAHVTCCLTDSVGKILMPVGFHPEGDMLRTRLIPTDFNQTLFLQGFITNPYAVVFRRMILLLSAAALMMLLVIGCIVWQVRVILRQNKVTRLREDFSYAMVHDMKTPLNSIRMGVHLLESGRLDANLQKRAGYLRILREESEHLLALTERILTLSKLEHKRLKLDKVTFPLRPVLEELAERYRQVASKTVTYVWHLHADTVYADKELLKEALGNLIDNAVKYSGAAVEITFTSFRSADGSLALSVRDNGIGIPLKEQRKIFEKFERASAVERGRKGGAAGFGLGLNYVQLVVKAHGGTVNVDSMEGEYTEFTLFLPSGEGVHHD